LYNKTASLYQGKATDMNGKLRITSDQYTDDGDHEKLHLTVRFVGDATQPSVFSPEFKDRIDTLSAQIETVTAAYRKRGNLITREPMTAHISVTGINMEQEEIERFMQSLSEALKSYEIELVKA